MASIIAISWTVLVLVAAPLAGILSRHELTDRVRPRSIIYAGSAINLVLIGIVTAAIDLWRDGQTIAALTAVLPLSRFLTWSIGVSFGCVAVSIGIFFLRGKLDRPPSTIVMQLLPETTLEYALFVALCILIGLVEEFLFRGFALLTLDGVLRSKVLAVAIVTVSFAVQHGIQDAIGIARAFVLGILLVIPVLVTGSLLPSVIAHAIIDAFSGVYGRSLLKCFGVNQRYESGARA